MSTSFTTHNGKLYQINRPPKDVSGLDPSHPLVAFEHAPGQTAVAATPSTTAENTVIFLGGLFDGLLTVPYVVPLVAALPAQWVLVEPVLSSNYRQWGISSLDDDVAELELLVGFFRQIRPNGRVVLLGHSTGSQMVMHYLLSEGKEGSKARRPKIDGGIMQAGISDREAMGSLVAQTDIDRACDVAQQYVKEGRAGHVLPFEITDPIFVNHPMTASRWLSIASPGPDHMGEDDYFSSDFSDERLQTTFGQLGKAGTRLSWLYGQRDQYVPETIDKQKLVSRWHHYAELGGASVDESSGLVEGATHTLKEGGAPTQGLVHKILGFLGRLESKK